MFHFTGCCLAAFGGVSPPSGRHRRPLRRRGYPIRTPTGQRALAARRGLSQLAASFLASWRPGIHDTPFCSLILLSLLRLLTLRRASMGLARSRSLKLSMLYPLTMCRCQRTGRGRRWWTTVTAPLAEAKPPKLGGALRCARRARASQKPKVAVSTWPAPPGAGLGAGVTP